MGLAHAGDQAAGGLDDARQLGDFAGGAGAHFHDGQVGAFVDAEEGEGDADVVVEVRLGGYHVVLLGQDGGDELLGGGLAVGAGDADHRDVELAAVVGGQLLQHFQGILNDDALPSAPGRPFEQEAVDDGIAGTRLQGVQGEIVPVERFSFQGKKHRAVLDFPAVGRNARTPLVESV